MANGTTSERTPSLDALKDVAEAVSSTVGTTKDALGKLLDATKTHPGIDPKAAAAVKGVAKATGIIGNLANVGLGYAINGGKGAAAAAVGTAVGAAIVLGAGFLGFSRQAITGRAS